jgi:hypothetical protein
MDLAMIGVVVAILALMVGIAGLVWNRGRGEERPSSPHVVTATEQPPTVTPTGTPEPARPASSPSLTPDTGKTIPATSTLEDSSAHSAIQYPDTGSTDSSHSETVTDPDAVRALPELTPATVAPDTPGVWEIITVTPPEIKRRARALRELTLPRSLESQRSFLSGRCFVMAVAIDESGKPSVAVKERGDIQEYFIQEAERDLMSTPWSPAVTEAEQKTSDTKLIKYCWPK